MVEKKLMKTASLLLALSAMSAQAQSYAFDANGLPILNSLSSAKGVAYLDFDGGTVFGHSTVLSPFGGDATFDEAEQAQIYKTWHDVAVHFAMFDINVTTVAPNKSTTPTAHLLISPDFNNASAQVGVFGNTNSTARGGVETSAGDNWLAGRSTVATHELGHIMGLYHQDAYDPYSEYRGKDSDNIAPIMGKDFQGKFSSWQDGFTGTSQTAQDDRAIISGNIVSIYNAFPGASYTGDGYRPDEHGNNQGGATALVLNDDGPAGAGLTNMSVTASGIIERLADVDMFSIDWDGGDLSMIAEAVKNLDASPTYASSLGMVLSLYDDQGSLIIQDGADPLDSPNVVLASVSATGLAAGTYYFAVESVGDYDDLGAYTLDFSGVAVPEPSSMLAMLGGAWLILGRRRRH